MRKLDRSVCPAPQCLGDYQHGAHSWDDVQPADKAQIRAQLEAMQGRRCAYCEGDIDVLGQHIEHFRPKGAHPALTFVWNNLYWSCDQNDSCGHFKDNGAAPYNVADLIDPCGDDPDDFFVFRADGTISLRSSLSPNEKWRAEETLRVFSLNPQWGRLRNMRKQAVSGYIVTVDEARAIFPAHELQEYLATELMYAEDLPFFTAIRHVLTERQ